MMLPAEAPKKGLPESNSDEKYRIIRREASCLYGSSGTDRSWRRC